MAKIGCAKSSSERYLLARNHSATPLDLRQRRSGIYRFRSLIDGDLDGKQRKIQAWLKTWRLSEFGAPGIELSSCCYGHYLAPRKYGPMTKTLLSIPERPAPRNSDRADNDMQGGHPIMKHNCLTGSMLLPDWLTLKYNSKAHRSPKRSCHMRMDQLPSESTKI
jgi:hypothetical protein